MNRNRQARPPSARRRGVAGWRDVARRRALAGWRDVARLYAAVRRRVIVRGLLRARRGVLSPGAAMLLVVVSLGSAPAASGSRPPSAPVPVFPSTSATLALPAPPVLARSSTRARRSAQGSAVAAVRGLLSGVPQAGTVLGYRRAPLTMQVFSDLECPFCRELALGAQGTLIRRYVRTGKLKIEFRSLETATREPLVFRAQQAAALAAGRQGKLWYFVELFYREQRQEGSGYVTPAYLQGIARQVPGLNLSAWNAARASAALTATLDRDEEAALRLHIRGTPALLIGRTGGHLSQFFPRSLASASSFEAAFARLLRSRS